MSADLPSVALALSTVGRPTLQELLDSIASSSLLPTAVAVADHTPSGDLCVAGLLPFPVLVVPSGGGASRGRNDAAAALPADHDVIGFPGDDVVYPPDTLRLVAEAFAARPDADAVATTLLDETGPRLRLPAPGMRLDRRTVWRSIEPALFMRRAAFDAVGGYRDDLGTGADTPWQSGDGTDMLLRLMDKGGTILSRGDITVTGRGERKGLSEEAFIAKHRAYARGTGYVYRVHDYPLGDRVRLLVAPLVKAPLLDPSLRLSLRLSVARSLGRWEGLTGRRLLGRPLRE